MVGKGIGGAMEKYFSLEHSIGYPRDAAIWFECTACGGRLPSDPPTSVACKCRNIIVDVDAGRIAVKDRDSMRGLRIEVE
jgi:hypothetical protein